MPHKMKLLHAFVAFATIHLVASATSRTLHFKGLDMRYAVLPQSLYYIRNAYACHYGIPVEMVAIESISWYNQTSVIEPSYHINDWQPKHIIPCDIIAATQWKSPEKIHRALRRELEAEEPVHIGVRIDSPIGVVPAYTLNMLPFLAAAVDEYYGELLGSPHIFMDAESAPISHLLQQLEDLELWTLLSVVVGLHLIGASGLLLIASRGGKRRLSDLPVADMV
jgi:hypothetical protein